MPSPSELHYRWQWELGAAPAALWPLVSNTDLFNRDCGLPPVEVVPSTETAAKPAGPAAAGSAAEPPESRRLRTKVMGLLIEWEERPFEWIAPHKFGVERTYRHGPVAFMRVQCELAPRPDGGTTLTYETWIAPANLLGRLAIPVRIGRQTRVLFERIFRRYDELARQGLTVSVPRQEVRPASATGWPRSGAGLPNRPVNPSTSWSGWPISSPPPTICRWRASGLMRWPIPGAWTAARC